MKIKDLQKIDLPREKLAKYGSEKLKDYELLALLLGLVPLETEGFVVPRGF